MPASNHHTTTIHTHVTLHSQALLGFVAFGMFAFVTHFLVTTRLDPREMVTEYGLAMSMTRRSCVFSYMGMGLAYALAGCSFAGFLPRITSKAACVIGLLPLMYVHKPHNKVNQPFTFTTNSHSYWCYILFFVTRIGAIRPLWVPVGAALFGLLAVYLHLEIQDTENQLADLKSMRYSFKKA